MRRVDEDFLLLARGGRTPHALPSHCEPGDPRQQLRVREELEFLNRARQPARARAPLQAVLALAGAVAGAVRRGGQLDA
jgi:hypothetical protein